MICHQFLITVVITLSCTNSYIGCAQSSKKIAPSKLSRQFREIDKMLVEKTSSDDPIVNMKFVESLITEAESSRFMGFKNKKNLAEAEKLFLSLTKVEDEKMCNEEGYKIISNNYKAIKKVCLGCNRIFGIYMYYLFRQEDICFPKCKKKLERKLAVMDRAKLKRLDLVMEKGMNKDPRGRTGVDELFSLVEMNYVGPSVEMLYETLINIPQDVSDDQELKKDMKPHDLEHLVVERYLIEPCNHVFANLAKDIFVPAGMWTSIHTPKAEQYDFYYNWARYQFCRTAFKAIGLHNDQ